MVLQEKKKKQNIQLSTPPVFHLDSDSKAKRFVQTLRLGTRKTCHENRSLAELLFFSFLLAHCSVTYQVLDGKIVEIAAVHLASIIYYINMP